VLTSNRNMKEIALEGRYYNQHGSRAFCERKPFFILLQFIITDKAKTSRGGGKWCRCYERRRGTV
jgi:hypothetical protein